MAPTGASTSLSPSISPSPTISPSATAPVDRMVKIELEAAEALAGLAGEVCRNRGEEVSERVENEVSAGNSGSNGGDLAAMSSYLDQDQKRCKITTKSVKAKQDAEHKSNPTSATSYASSRGSKSRQNLTEAEKESRRLRRVLANRESARQTIRRRQALFDELTRKAADLALENDNLKEVKELAEKEYDCLRSTNERLKAEMAEMVKSEEEETQGESKSTRVDTSTSPPTTCPVFIYNPPSFLQYLWPSIVQPSNVVSADSLQERENPRNINSPQTPLYLVPYPWLFPLPHHGSVPHLQQNETSPNDQSTTSSSSRPVVHLQNHHSLLLVNNKAKPSTSTEAMPANKNQENPFGFPSDGGGLHLRGTLLKPTPLSCVSTSNHPAELACDVKRSRLADCDRVKEPKNVVNVFAAADARKRRKELKRLKDLHCH